MKTIWSLGLWLGVLCGCKQHPEPPSARLGGPAANRPSRLSAEAPASAMTSSRTNVQSPGTAAGPAAGAPRLREFTVRAATEMTWKFESHWGPLHVVVRVPQRTDKQRFGALVALHGRGESLKGSARGARGWLDDYNVVRAIERLKSPPLASPDFQGFVSPPELQRFNQRLSVQPYRDIILLMPYLPDVLKKDAAFKNAPKLASFVQNELLLRAKRELPLIAGTALSIDGVSLGGRAALLMAFATPESFVSAGSLQAAIDETEVARFTVMAKRATQRSPDLQLRLLTSDEDYYQSVNRELSSSFTNAGVPHEFRVVQGTHSYEFNRGPGALEMLIFHSRYLSL